MVSDKDYHDWPAWMVGWDTEWQPHQNHMKGRKKVAPTERRENSGHKKAIDIAIQRNWFAFSFINEFRHSFIKKKNLMILCYDQLVPDRNKDCFLSQGTQCGGGDGQGKNYNRNQLSRPYTI